MRRKLKSIFLGMAATALMLAAIPVLCPGTAAEVQAASADQYSVKVDAGYLALRSSPAYDSSNEIGQLYTGDLVEVLEYGSGKYWWVYSYKYNRNGYVNKNYLVYAGNTGVAGTRYDVCVSSGYLALRNAKAYNSNNEIGQLYNSDYVLVQDTSDSTYWWVYSPKYDRYGYVNRNYLAGAGSSYYTDDTEYTVSVATGYLALRSAPSYNSSNETGQLYSGDVVYLQERSTNTYWWVYSPKYGKSGYVNCNYLYKSGDDTGYLFTRTVSVSSGYLALRSAKAYNSNNEIGCLYTGDTVYVYDTSHSKYWYVYSPKLDRYGYVNRNYLY